MQYEKAAMSRLFLFMFLHVYIRWHLIPSFSIKQSARFLSFGHRPIA